MAKSIVVTNELYKYLQHIRERDFEKVDGKPISIPKMIFEIIGVWNNVRGYTKHKDYGNKGTISDVRLGSTTNGKRRRNLQTGEIRNYRTV